MADYAGHVKLLDTSLFPDLAVAEGKTVPCIVQVFKGGDKLYHVAPVDLMSLGCDGVELDDLPYPFFEGEVEELK